MLSVDKIECHTRTRKKEEDLCYLLPKKKKKTFKSAKTAAKLLKQERNNLEKGCCRHKEHHQLNKYSDSLILNFASTTLQNSFGSDDFGHFPGP
ncbi:unnamed protein product, partial [Brassica rapa]